MNFRIVLLGCFVVFPLVLTTCDDTSTEDESIVPANQSLKPDPLTYRRLFSELSPFYNSIPTDAVIDPNSEAMVEGLISQAVDQAFLVVVKEWTSTVFFADASTPRETVSLTQDWAPFGSLKNVPIPEFAEPDPMEDAHMVIVDEINGCVYDFWETRHTTEGWKAGWGNALPLASDGIFPQGMSARGSGFEIMQGLIWPQELEAGLIDHALIFSYDLTRAGGPVTPATESDGESTGSNTIPEGALIRLNPDLDLSLLGLNRYETTIAVCLQTYGMYCADDGGGLSLYAVNPLSVKTNPYENIWGDETYIDMHKIPASEFQVMQMGEQMPDAPIDLVENSCANFQ